MIDLNAIGSQEFVIGCLINKGPTVSNVEICNTVPNDAFTVPFLRLAFEALKSQMSKGLDHDIVELHDVMNRMLAKRSEGEHENQFSRLAHISRTTTISNADGHANKLKQCHRIRTIQDAMHNMQQSLSVGASIDEIAATLEKVVNDAADAGAEYQTTSVSDLVDGYADHLEGKIGQAGPQTGFVECDKLLGKVKPGHMITIGARPGNGKTEFACAWMLNAAKNQGLNVLMMSLEMTKEEIMDRLVAIDANIPPSLLDNPLDLDGNGEDEKMGTGGWSKVSAALAKIKGLDIYIHDEPSVTLGKMRSVIKTCERQSGRPVDIVFCDYLQLMKDPTASNRLAELSNISMGTKKLAKDFKLPIVQLVQLNRGTETQQREPRPSDIKECGQIEQDSDKIILLHGETDAEKEQNQNLKKVIFGKVRQGKRGAVALEFTNGHFYDTDRKFIDQEEIKMMERQDQERNKAEQARSITQKIW